ncbi:MAG: ABC transporter permease [Candidatus Entotheonellia bacterium]
MRRYLARRAIAFAITLLLVSFVTFVVMYVIPGDPAEIILGTEGNPEALAALRARLGLDRPLLLQYLDWLKQALSGNLGVSIQYDVPVGQLIASRLPVTFPLAGLAISLTIFAGIPLGILAASRHRRPGDVGMMLFSQLGMAIPSFWAGLLLMLLFSVYLGWFPAGGFTSWAETPAGALRSLVLPAIALGLVQMAVLTRTTRSALLEVLREDYVQTARSKGLSDRLVLYKHALKNSFITIVTLLGLQIGHLLAGSIIIENVFYLPGLGRLVLGAIGARDLPVVQGVVLFMATMIVIVNFAVDLLYGWLDPRIRYN